ncbi:MAG: ABC transporter ATP-binding protein [Planctomycetota bacterium]
MADTDNPVSLIELDAVSKHYRLGDQTVRALDRLSLTVAKPGFYGIMGPSGSGKSTLLHLLAALDQPDEGTIRVAGEHLHTMQESALTAFRRKKIGIIFQQFNLIPTLSALDNVALPALLDGMPAAERTERATALLERMGLGDRMHHRPDAMSGGEQQRVAIARALLFEPQVLLADEPTGNLDSATGERILQLLGDIAREGRTVLMVTHEPTAATACGHVFLLRDGRIETELDTDGLAASELVARLQ